VDPDAILHELTYASELPREALLAASARREEMVPIFLREIESFLAASSEERRKPMLLFFIFHLLGDWKERSAYQPLAGLLRCARGDVERVVGESVTGTTHRVMAAVYDGDPQPLMDIILDPDADEYVRSRMCEALAMVTLQGQADRERVSQFLRDGFTSLRPQEDCFVWNGWQSAIAMLGLRDLVPLVKEAFERGFIDPHWLTFKHFEEDLNGGKRSPAELFRLGDPEYTLFGDTIEELSTWYAFSERYEEDQAREASDRGGLWGPRQGPTVNPYKNVGRNDPCPCGSGKKFKKCCLQA
jgi:hypothetical protein